MCGIHRPPPHASEAQMYTALIHFTKLPPGRSFEHIPQKELLNQHAYVVLFYYYAAKVQLRGNTMRRELQPLRHR